MKRVGKKIPVIPYWVLKHLYTFSLWECFSGDIEEDYQYREENDGKFRAVLWIWFQALRSLPIFIILYLQWSGMMIYRTLKTTLRTIRKQKGYSFINVIGLAIGMAVFLLITLFVGNELSYDQFHLNGERLYRVVTGDPQDKNSFVGTPAPLGPLMKESLPEIVQFARVEVTQGVLRYKEKAFHERRIFYADPSFFDLFTFPLIQGNPKTALKNLNSIVITVSMAEKYFGDEDPLGKVINMDGKDDFIVTAVAEDVPENAHFHFDFLIHFEHVVGYLDHWGAWNFHTYLLLQHHLTPKNVKERFDAWARGTEMEDIFKNLHYQSIFQIHFLYNRSNFEPSFNGKYIQIFTAVAIVILVLACINYINLSTARSVRRAMEVGIKKTVGVHRGRLMRQFIGESLFITLVALLIALGFIHIAIPVFNTFTGRTLTVEYSDIQFVGILTALIAVTGLLSGSYPAFVLSSFKPTAVLKGEVQRMGSGFRNVLVVFQFAISIVLIICTLVISRQMRLIHTMDLGLNKDHVVNLQLNRLITDRIPVLKDAFSKIPSVVHVSSNAYSPANVNWNQSVWWQGQEEALRTNMWIIGIDRDFMETLEISMVEGGDLIKTYPYSDKWAYILNRSALAYMGWKTALGKAFSIYGEEGKGNVIGVIEDFHFRSLHHEIAPCVMVVRERWQQISVRIRPTHIDATLEAIEDAWKTIIPQFPLTYSFLDETFDALYKSERKLNQLVIVFTMLSLLIACLGLFSLASFTAEQKTKEIGIRKVVGASISGIIYLLSVQYARWVLLANLFAWPVAYLALRLWLRNFAYRIALKPDAFVVSSLLALFVAILMVSFQSAKAALANPVEALKYE